MKAPRESEIKLAMPDAAAARAAVERLGAVPRVARCFEDNVLYDDAEHSLAGRGAVMRLRRAGGHAILTFKGPREVVDGIKQRTELEVEVADADAAAGILVALGLTPVFRYQKYRAVYDWKDVEIVIDETPVGVYLEIEGPPATIHAAAAGLGKNPSDYINESYVALFFAAGGRGDMLFK